MNELKDYIQIAIKSLTENGIMGNDIYIKNVAIEGETGVSHCKFKI